ncbi:hypothetical protein [Marinobacterium arenosum]|uniref:hypothetical protein n=1 Tax=Marinobacterium arenosum TaxID=2862496 RepID=UPI001C9692A0|nr:hypothetical protein [Marinobacterium arenosum]MBY4675796.1 hypothetical protein [Marinobacterium arenosum]
MTAPLRIVAAPLLILMLLVASGCSARFVAPYDATVQEQIIEVARKVDLFWGWLLETPVEQRQYVQFADSYNEIESDLRMLQMRNDIRPFNRESTRQTAIALELWQQDRADHKLKDSFSDFLAKRHRQQFIRIFTAMARGEQAKQTD